MAGEIIPITGRWRPPDPEKETAAADGDRRRGGRIGSLTQQNSNSTGGGGGASGPFVFVQPFGGQFSATFLRRGDGTEHRLQIFADPYAAGRCAKLLNAALLEARL